VEMKRRSAANKRKSIPPSGFDADAELVTKFHSESDRAAGVLAGAYLDAFLDDLLRDVLVPGCRTDELFEGQGPLRSFGAKISLAYALGISDDNVSRDMDLIRKIRNHFAHNVWDAQFGTPPVSQWCSELRVIDAAVDKNGNTVKLQNPARERYLITIGLCILRLVMSPKVSEALREQTTGIRNSAGV
jgi:hypothetical protein